MSIKWFFALNDAGDDYVNYCLMAQVAVMSARRHTQLEPIFLFDGEACALTVWMQHHGVRVIHHRTSMYERLVEHARTSGRKESVTTGAGAYLRLDIPELCEKLGIDDRYVLYTDCDVMFCRDVSEHLLGLEPEFFAAAPQFDRGNYEDMNSGVLWMNVPRLRQMLEPFRAFVIAEMDALRKSGYDQAALRAFYGKRRSGRPAWNCLPLELNWKPHWGPNEQAVIVHFHGPKPTTRTWLARGMAPTIYVGLANDTYYDLCRRWDDYAHGLSLQAMPVRRSAVKLDPLPGVFPDFDEQVYLHAYPDVARAVALHQFADGYEHYQSAGRWELRSPAGRSDPEETGPACGPPEGERAASRLWSALFARFDLANFDAALAGPVLVVGSESLARRFEVVSARAVQRTEPRAVLKPTDAGPVADEERPGIAVLELRAQDATPDKTLALLAGLRRRLRPGALVALWIGIAKTAQPGRPGTNELARDEWSRHYRVLHVHRRIGGDRQDLAILRMPEQAV